MPTRWSPPEPVESPAEEESTAQTPTTVPDSPETEENPAPETSPEPQPTQQPQAEQGTAITPPKPAQLIAAQPSAQINLRSRPTINSESKGYGLVGAPVQLLRTTQAGDGYDWVLCQVLSNPGPRGVDSGRLYQHRRSRYAVAGPGQYPAPVRGVTGSPYVYPLFYDSNGRTLTLESVSQNLETNNTFRMPRLSPDVRTDQQQPTYSGNASPPYRGHLSRLPLPICLVATRAAVLKSQ